MVRNLGDLGMVLPIIYMDKFLSISRPQKLLTRLFQIVAFYFRIVGEAHNKDSSE